MWLRSSQRCFVIICRHNRKFGKCRRYWVNVYQTARRINTKDNHLHAFNRKKNKHEISQFLVIFHEVLSLDVHIFMYEETEGNGSSGPDYRRCNLIQPRSSLV